MPRIVVAVLLFLGTVLPAQASIVIVGLGKDEIFIATDSREFLGKSFRDNGCKNIVLGEHMAFAVLNMHAYSKTCDALSLAINSFSPNDSIETIARRWADSASSAFYASPYLQESISISVVKSETSTQGFFLGFTPSGSELLLEKIGLVQGTHFHNEEVATADSEGGLRWFIFGVVDMPRELLTADSDSARAVRAKWYGILQAAGPDAMNLQVVHDLISSAKASEYGRFVGGAIHILKLRRGAPAFWLEGKGCAFVGGH